MPSSLSASDQQQIECNQYNYYSIKTPGITIGSILPVATGSTSIGIPYSAPINSPSTYSIQWDNAAISAGFINISNYI